MACMVHKNVEDLRSTPKLVFIDRLLKEGELQSMKHLECSHLSQSEKTSLKLKTFAERNKITKRI